MKIRPVAGLNTGERKAQYTVVYVVYENQVEKSVTAQEKAHLKLFFPAKNLFSCAPLKEMGPSIGPGQTTARTNYSNQVSYFH